MMKAWYPWYPTDFDRDTLLLSIEERCLYRDLLDFYWMLEGDITLSSARKLAVKRGFSTRKFNKLWESIAIYLPEIDGKLTNPRMDQELEKAREKHAKAVRNGRAGGLAKASQTLKQTLEQIPTSPQPQSHSPPKKQGGEPPDKPSDLPVSSSDFNSWAKKMADQYGYPPHRHSGKVLEIFKDWEDKNVTQTEVHEAHRIGSEKHNTERPSILYLNGIIQGLRREEAQKLRPKPTLPARNFDSVELTDEERKKQAEAGKNKMAGYFKSMGLDVPVDLK